VNELLVKPLPSKLPRVAVYLDADMKKDLETLAKLDKRSVSNLIYAWVVDNIESAKREGKLGDRTNSKGAK
jgi:CopG-like RHH_1 or ribbon-helix-helix domain, RHH_5